MKYPFLKFPAPPDDTPYVSTPPFHLPPEPPPPYSTDSPVIDDLTPLPPSPVYNPFHRLLLPAFPPSEVGAAPPPPPPVSQLLSTLVPPEPEEPSAVARPLPCLTPPPAPDVF